MSDPYIGEIKMFAGHYVPRYWAYCNGQPVPISQIHSLYTLIGDTYGGDGRTTYALPDLQRRIPIGDGGAYSMGQCGGRERVGLTNDQMPAHRHQFMASKDSPTEDVGPAGNFMSGNPNLAAVFPVGLPKPMAMINGSVASTGKIESHSNLMPSLCVNFIIALKGTFPAFE